MRRDDIRQDEETDHRNRVSLGDLFAMLHRRRYLIAVVTTLITLAVVGVVLVWPNRYEAVAVVQLDPRPKKVTQFDNVYEGLKPDTPTIESEAEIAISGPVLRSVMQRLGLNDDPELAGAPDLLDRALRHIGLAAASPASDASSPSRPRTTPPATPPAVRPGDFEQLSGARGGPDGPVREPHLIAFNDRVSARRLRNTQLIEIRYSSRDPVKAARVATAIAESYILAQINSKREAVEVANTQIEKRIGDLRTSLATTEQQIEQLRSKLGVFQADGGQLTERQLSREMESLVNARRRTADAAARYEEARRAFGGDERPAGRNASARRETVPDMFRSTTLRTLEDTLDKAERRFDEMRQKYGPLHPERQRAESELATARAALDAEHANIHATARAELAIARQSEAELGQRLTDLKADVSRLKESEWQLKALEREANSTREIYEHLLSRRKQTTEAVELQIADARVIDRALVPLKPASPKRKQIVIGALFGSLVLAVGLALVLELMQPGIVSPGHAERDLDLALITALPKLDAVTAEKGGGRTHDNFVESVREIRHALDDGRPPGRQLSVLLASALPGEGKSLVALSLADQYAADGGRTLLIDADLRRGQLTYQRAGHPQAGLTEILAGDAAVDHCLQYDPVANYTFLACGRASDYATPASTLLASPAMAQLMSRLAHEFDTIIIDGPPLLPVIDGRILAQYADDILFVATVRKTPKDQVRRALKTLGQNAEKVLGIVVNRIDRSDRYFPYSYEGRPQRADAA